MNDMIVNVKGAVAIAVEYVKALYDLSATAQIRLEETIKQDDGHWLITLSYKNPEGFESREYKILEVDPSHHEVIAMKIRQLEFSGIDGGVI